MQCLFGFAPLAKLQHHFLHFLKFLLSPLIAVMRANLSFESFALDHTTFALLLETTLFLSKKHEISVYLLSHLADFDSSISLHKHDLVSTIFFGQQPK